MKKVDLWEKIIVETVSTSVKSFVVICLSALGVVLVSIYNPLAEILTENVPKSILLLLPLTLLLLLILAVLYIFYLRKKLNNELKESLTVYWDKNLNAYCPSCKKLLTNYGFYPSGIRNYPGFECVNYKAIIRISDGKNIFLSLAEAKKINKNLFTN